MSRLLSRRSLLQGIAAGCALSPWLFSRQAAAQATPPKRLVLLFNPNGTITDEFWPGEAATETSFQLGTILQPLAPFQDRLLLLRGLDLSVTSRGPGGPHQRGMGALFTGRPLQTGTMVGGDGSLAGWADGVSVDQELVSQLRPPTLLPSLELGVRATAPEVRSRLIYSAPGNPVPPLNNPVEVFERLVSGFASPGVDEPASEEAKAQRRLVLAAVQSQYEALSPRISGEDRVKLERHSEFVQGIVRRLDFRVEEGPYCARPEEPALVDFDGEQQMPDVVRQQLDLLVLALSCDITRVASVQFSNAINAIRFPWMDSLAEGHALSHRGPSDTQAQDQLVQRSRWYAEQVAYLLGRLAAIPEGEGTLLDNTLVLWGNELSVGNVHSLNSIPFVLAGNVGGQLRTGRYLRYGGQSHTRLLSSILQLMGANSVEFGDPDFAGGGPLTDLA